MLKEFREFAMKGNVIDLAVGVLIGAAFGKIVDSLVKDIFTPAFTPLIGKVDDFAKYKVGPFGVGNFINNVLQFLIVAFALFLVVKAINKFKRGEAAVPITEDPVAKQSAQNDRMIELLEQIAAKEGTGRKSQETVL